ncbi:ABC transporter ATP-binding protein [Micromonospora aurantiaca]|uniref:Dipeptide ABC transporter ATP-binding protein n=1 Tax=Micromonospora aurantiaca (nom. illeg.) TaxID=47850 RepID=A0ABQ6UPU1_9ACTN|nr:ABC transporter ATP-binding protein [Micromonospora aurantiaca]KAB1119258.1 dipeptide ABC transporter ATP-binding protein [Micromonospora aurantiaca]UFN97659.1 ABC transporter ATP-binding protein [Micromonospora aurantiaca]
MLSIENLSVTIRRPGRQVAALSGVSFAVRPGEVVGLVGESGGGKSMVARAIVGLLPGGSHATGRVLFGDSDVLRMDDAALAAHRGRGVAICFQNPRGALSPTRTIGKQLVDRLATHQEMSGDRAREAARELFEAVGIRSPQRRLDAYAHELSGGMAQRVMISLATGCAPELLIADEPTTGLDVTLTREILRQFRHAADTDGRGVLLISHDLASIAEVCDRVVVLYAGTVVESGPAAQVLREPAHPYTRALLRSVPDVGGRPVVATPGAMPLLTQEPHNCPFVARCAHADGTCSSRRPATVPVPGGGEWSLACFHPQTRPLDADVPQASHTPAASGAVSAGADAKPAVLEIENAHVVYRSRFGSGGHHALRGVTLRLGPGETLGVVGESGCGKSTLAKLVMGLVAPTSGTVTVAGQALVKQPGRPRPRGRALRRARTRAQLVFQDPIGSLSPRRPVGDSIAEPLRAAGLSPAQREERVTAVLDRMELDRSILQRYPHELSGGQAQRIGIARALVGEPDLIVFDEPTSALDVTVQAQILDVIADVAADAERASVFISHDLATVRGFADRVVVLYLGRVVEEGPVDVVFDTPRHPYTRALLGSAPRLGGTTGSDGEAVELVKDLEEADAATGCPLAARCPFVTDRCRAEQQELQSYGESRAACWRVPELPALIGRQAVTP